MLRLEGLVSILAVKQLRLTASELIAHDDSYQRGHHSLHPQCLDLDSDQNPTSLETHSFKHDEQLIDLHCSAIPTDDSTLSPKVNQDDKWNRKPFQGIKCF